MRLLTRKIYRAYPELDKFEDDVCMRYIKRARRLQNAWKFWFSLVLVLPLSIGVWIVLVYMTGMILNHVNAPMSYSVEIALYLFIATGIVWVPAFSILLIRDRWLHRCIRKQLTGVQCGACGYSLLGLTIQNESNAPSVHCPECGLQTVLKDMGLTHADIDPNYQPTTP